MTHFMRISFNYLCVFILIVTSMVCSTVSQGLKNTTKAKIPDVDDYLVQELEADQNMDYSVTELDHQSILTMAWWLTKATRATKTTTSRTTELYPIFKLMPNISSLLPAEKMELLKNPTLFNDTVELHIIYLYGYPKSDAYDDMAEKVTTALENDIEVAQIVSERDARLSSLAELTVDNLTTSAPIDDYSMLFGPPSPEFIDFYTTQETSESDPFTSTTTETTVARILVRQKLQEQVMITPTTAVTLKPRFMDPDTHLVEHGPPEIHEVTTTISPLIVNIKENMLVLKNGPFSGFLHGFLGVLALKNAAHSKELYEALDRVIGANSVAKKYDNAMGYDVGLVLKKGAELLNSLPMNAVPNLANTLKDLIEIRSVVFDSDTLQLISELDQFYNTNEAEALLNTILPIYEYPKDRSADDVAGELDDCVFKPFMNTPPAQIQRKALIMELLQKELEKRNLLAARRNYNSPDCNKMKRKDTFQFRGHLNYTNVHERHKNFTRNKNDDCTGPVFGHPGPSYYLNKRIVAIASDVQNKYYYKNNVTAQHSNIKFIQKNRKHKAFGINTGSSLKTPIKTNQRYRDEKILKPASPPAKPKSYNLNNKRQLSRYIPHNQYARNKNYIIRLKILQPLRAMQSRYLTPKYDFTYKKRQEKKSKIKFRNNDVIKLLKDSSYSDDESDLKFNLQDALRHPHPIVQNHTEHLNGDFRQMGLKNKTNLDDSSYSDE